MSEPIFVINGFYSAMREKFTKDDVTLHYYVVEWDTAKLSWADFRGKTLGTTDPADAAAGSLRKMIAEKWQDLGLKSEPNVGDNGVHASASPFEAMAERMNWLEAELEKDTFAAALLAAGMSKETILEWSKDPQVEVEEGKKGSIFDALEDIDSNDCLAKAATIAKATAEKPALATNQAFVFIKPHAVTDATKALVAGELAAAGIKILSEGDLDGPTIASKKLIDNHYYAIAVKASLTKPADLNPPEPKQAEFAEKFGLSWSDALAQGKVFNAVDACEQLKMDGDQLDGVWAKAKAAKQLVKFGGGFYCGLVDPKA